jgi:membrane-associated phospholipid phosphatase
LSRLATTLREDFPRHILVILRAVGYRTIHSEPEMQGGASRIGVCADEVEPTAGAEAFVLRLLCTATATVLLFEQAGVETRLQLRLRGDLGREARWLGQYGQLSCVVICVVFMWTSDASQRHALPLLVAVLATAGLTVAIKRLTGRVRPSFEQAGQFLGPVAAGAAEHQSFPSGHMASPVALSVCLSRMYPRARGLFWGLAVTCGLLRWVANAHWLSDVLAGT